MVSDSDIILKVCSHGISTVRAQTKENLVQSQKASVIRFIESYAHHSATRNIPALVSQFAETFLAAGPGGAQCVRAADFARALPRRIELFDSLGCQSTELIETHESQLDARYALVNTTWRFTFRGAEGAIETVDSESIFVIDRESDPFQILLYLNPRDIMETLRERGIGS